MTAEAPAGLPAELTGLPALTLDEAQLGDLELLLSGAYPALAGYLSAADVASVEVRGTLLDGTRWPVPITLDVPAASVKPDPGRILLQDPEGTPLAFLDVMERTPFIRGGHQLDDELVRLSGPVTPCRAPEHGPFRQLRRQPAEVREQLAGGAVLGYVTRAPLHGRQIGQLRHAAGQLKARLLLLPLVSGPAEVVRRPDALVRTVRAAARHLPPGTLVVPVPLPPHDTTPAGELALRAEVAAAYGATHLLAEAPLQAAAGLAAGGPANGGPAAGGRAADGLGTVIPVISPGEWAYDPAAEVWRPLALIEAGTERADLASGELEDLLDRGEQVPAWFTPPAVAQELRRARPARSNRGLVIFLTGLSGSGKSTIARALRDALSERGDRTVSLLDGDLVRTLLSAGLTFSRADRDLNIARIGFVATEIARHGGIAICAPIAPYAQARAEVRKMAREAGDFLLIHVATPAGVCEARDRKGLYAKARAGLIDHFTGVSDPYEAPDDADLVIDTSTMTRQESLQCVLDLLAKGGWLPAGEGGS